jgi:predicted phage-related endonuclease
MIYINSAQGSEAWLAERAEPNTFTASELSAAAGKSKYMARAKLLKQKFNGFSEEVDGNTQALFNKGHAAEFGARPLAEAIIGDELSPVTGYIQVDGMRLLASLDGITFCGDVIFEHKLYSESLAAQVRSGELEPHYTLQIDQQLLVSGANKCLFMTSDGTEQNMAWMWYDRPADLSHVALIWQQFAKDLAAYSPAAESVNVTAEPVMALPSLAVQIRGEVTASNLPVFMSAADAFLDRIKTVLKTDQDFADAEANVKACKAAEDGIEQTKKAITAQATSIDEVMRTMDLYKEKLSTVRLKLDKLVKSEKESRKAQIVTKASADFYAYVASLEAETKPINLNSVGPNFADVIKGLKTLSSMQEKVDTALRDGKFTADQVAKDVRAKLAWCKENAAGKSALFPDLQVLMAKPFDDFTLTIISRIEKQKAEEAARLEAERTRIQAEEEAKARAKVDAEERQRVAAETKAQLEAQAKAKVDAEDAVEERRNVVQLAEQKKPIAAPVLNVVQIKLSRPSDEVIITSIASIFNVPYIEACNWVLEIAEAMKRSS